MQPPYGCSEKYGIDYAQGYHIGRAMPQPLEFQVDGEPPQEMDARRGKVENVAALP